MKKAVVFLALALALALGFAQAGHADDWDHGKSNQKAVFVMTNAADSNEILSYQRQVDGSLKPFGRFRTGGRGSGGTVDPLGSQGSLTLSQDRTLLFAVNAGTGNISSFRVNGPNLRLVDVEPSGGSAPVSVAQHGDLLYVLNFAGNSNVSGLRVNYEGRLEQIPGSVRYLTAANSGGSDLAFSPDGRLLVATEKLTNNINVFPVQPNGTLGAVVVTKDPGAGLFDFAFAPSGAILALEAAARTISSFLIESTGALTPLSVGIATMAGGTCWNAVTPDGHYVYTANTAGANISGYAISGAGVITALPGTIVFQFPAGTTDLDMAISGDGKYLYTLNVGNGTIGILAIQADGTLKLVGILPAFTAGTGQNGIAAL